MVARASGLRSGNYASWKPALPSLIERNIALKAEIVAADEREQNDTRSLLNFGHTIGHAIEYAAGYGNMLHGEAISLGIMAAAHVSACRAGLSSGEAKKISAALQAHRPSDCFADRFPARENFRSASARQEIRRGPDPFCGRARNRSRQHLDRSDDGRSARRCRCIVARPLARQRQLALSSGRKRQTCATSFS